MTMTERLHIHSQIEAADRQHRVEYRRGEMTMTKGTRKDMMWERVTSEFPHAVFDRFVWTNGGKTAELHFYPTQNAEDPWCAVWCCGSLVIFSDF